MKKVLLILIGLILFSVLTIALLDVFEIWSLRELVVTSIQEHPRIEPYLQSEEDLRALEEDIQRLEAQIVTLEKEKADLQRTLEMAYNQLGDREEALAQLEAESTERDAAEEDRADRMRQLARVYSQMSADDAAQVLEGLDDELIIELMFLWDDRFAGRVLSSMDTARSARISEMIAE